MDEAPGDASGSVEGCPKPRLGWKTPIVVLLFYALAIAIATYPRVARMGDTLPGQRVDPLNHIVMMKWYKSCLLEGKNYVFDPNLQQPVGYPLALNSPLILQAAMFLPLSIFVSSNDYLCYNLIWFAAYLFSGFSVFVLAWTVLRDRFAAGFAGLVGMLCTPMMMRGHGHLELMFAGSMGLFLASWINWVDRPSWKGLALVVSSYLIAALGAAYFAVLPIVPAAFYVVWRMFGSGGGLSGSTRWLASRLGWFAGFVALTVPGMLLVFSSQFWASSRGISMERPLSEFERFGSPLLSYVVPTRHHAAFAALPVEWDVLEGYPTLEVASYVGIVTVLLIGFAAVRRASFPRAGYWWITLATLVVLSMGAYLTVDSHRIPLPALWLRQTVPMFKSLRAPSRFNLLACIVAAMIAGAGLRSLLASVRNSWTRGAIGAVIVGLTLADLSIVPFLCDPERPAVPEAYAWIKARNPKASLLEAPVVSSGCPAPLTETCAYWQSFHGLQTSAGYSSFISNEFDDLMVDDSPFYAMTLSNPFAFVKPDSMSIGVVADVGLRDYAWLVAKRGKFDYILLHRWDDSMFVRSAAFNQLILTLQEALVQIDPKVLVYDAARLTTPTRPVFLCDEGFRSWRGRPGPPMRVVAKSGRLKTFVPESAGKLVFSIEARAFRHPRKVTLRSGKSILASWDVGTSGFATFETPPISLPVGLQDLRLESDGEDAPTSPDEVAFVCDPRPYALQVTKLRLAPAP